MSDTVNSSLDALKEFYSKDKVYDMVYQKQPWFKMIRKENKARGEPNYRVPLIYGLGSATSSVLPIAQSSALANSVGITEFLVPRSKTFSVGYIDDDLFAASNGDEASFVDMATKNVDHTILQLARDLGIALSRSGYGDRGFVSTTAGVLTGTVLTLSLKSDSNNFEKGQFVCVSPGLGQANRTPGSANVTAGGAQITGVDRVAGTLTFAHNINDSTNGISAAIAVGDPIYIAGDAVVGYSKPVGLGGFLPLTAPSVGESFLGIDRSVDRVRLAGNYVDGTVMSITEAIDVAVDLVSEQEGEADVILMSYNTYTNLKKENESKYRISKNNDDATVGFRKIEVATQEGMATIIVDKNIQDDRFYVLESKSWKYMSLFSEELYTVGSDYGDFLEYFRGVGTDAWELRMKYSGGCACEAPSHNCVVQINP